MKLFKCLMKTESLIDEAWQQGFINLDLISFAQVYFSELFGELVKISFSNSEPIFINMEFDDFYLDVELVGGNDEN